MTLFRDYTMKWWQFGLLKVCMLAFGILVGSTWPAIFSASWVIALLCIIFIVPAVYLVVVTFGPAGKKSQ